VNDGIVRCAAARAISDNPALTTTALIARDRDEARPAGRH